jgi:predicted TIM-barrel fold metal-dependent hydrolase
MVIDAYAHVGPPRFPHIDDYRIVMAEAGIGRALLCSFDSSPDFVHLHAVLARWPTQFRVIGVPLGNDRAEVQAGVEAQLAAGFSGLRLTETDVMERPWLLERLGQAGAVTLVSGKLSAPAPASALLGYLERYPDAVLVGCHFAGGGEPAALQSGAAAALFSHPNFLVNFSRHGAFDPAKLEAWARAVIDRVGWQRVLWGSETPILFWRNETMASALRWCDRLAPTDAERRAFFSGNAERLYFSKDVRLDALQLPFDPQQRTVIRPAGMWPTGLPLDQRLAGRLVHAWLQLAPAERGTLQDYLETVLDRCLPPLP